MACERIGLLPYSTTGMDVGGVTSYRWISRMPAVDQ